MSPALRALSSGIAGAVALTAIHQAARRVRPDAPRMDIVGMRALSRLMIAAGRIPPPPSQLYRLTLAGDLLANSLYYAAVPARDRAATVRRALLLGTGAGLGALLLPRPMGLDAPPHSESRANQVMTVAWYLAGAMAAAAWADQAR